MPHTQYPNIDQLLAELQTQLQSALGSQLQGFYLFGSLVGGDFDEKTSDIDLLTIVRDEITEQELAALETAHRTFASKHPEWHDRIEVAYVPKEGMKHFKTRTCQIARISPGEPLHYRDMDIEWLMDWYVVQEQGLTLFGPSPDTFIPKITIPEFLHSLRDSMGTWPDRARDAKWVGYQSYIILSVCRSLAAFEKGEQVSKVKGAEWASDQFPQWSDLIKRAVGWHGSPDKWDSPDTQAETIRFVDFALTQLPRSSTKSSS